MLKQASVTDLTMDRVSRDSSYIVITMRRYPRFVNKQLRDEYHTSMSPDWSLFEDWIAAKRRFDNHDGAFDKAHFEERFGINSEGMENLARLSALAAEKDVYLVCQCQSGKRCHREFLLILARKLFGANAEKPKNEYPVFEARVDAFKKSTAFKKRSALLADPVELNPPLSPKYAGKPVQLKQTPRAKMASRKTA